MAAARLQLVTETRIYIATVIKPYEHTASLRQLQIDQPTYSTVSAVQNMFFKSMANYHAPPLIGGALSDALSDV